MKIYIHFRNNIHLSVKTTRDYNLIISTFKESSPNLKVSDLIRYFETKQSCLFCKTCEDKMTTNTLLQYRRVLIRFITFIYGKDFGKKLNNTKSFKIIPSCSLSKNFELRYYTKYLTSNKISKTKLCKENLDFYRENLLIHGKVCYI